MDWNVSAVATFGNFSLTVGYTDSDLEGPYEIQRAVPDDGTVLRHDRVQTACTLSS